MKPSRLRPFSARSRSSVATVVGQLVDREVPTEPSVAPAGRSPQRRRRVAADEHGHVRLSAPASGTAMTSSKSQNSPWNELRGVVHSSFMTWMYSSQRSPRRSHGTPSATYSSCDQPTPTPSRKRPPAIWSSDGRLARREQRVALADQQHGRAELEPGRGQRRHRQGEERVEHARVGAEVEHARTRCTGSASRSGRRRRRARAPTATRSRGPRPAPRTPGCSAASRAGVPPKASDKPMCTYGPPCCPRSEQRSKVPP